MGKRPRSAHERGWGALSDSCSAKWMNSGIVSHGEYWTRNSSEWPSDAAVCFLSDILEPNPPQRFSLSPTACQGILNRAVKRGRSLPAELDAALVRRLQVQRCAPSKHTRICRRAGRHAHRGLACAGRLAVAGEYNRTSRQRRPTGHDNVPVRHRDRGMPDGSGRFVPLRGQGSKYRLHDGYASPLPYQ